MINGVVMSERDLWFEARSAVNCFAEDLNSQHGFNITCHGCPRYQIVTQIPTPKPDNKYAERYLGKKTGYSHSSRGSLIYYEYEIDGKKTKAELRRSRVKREDGPCLECDLIIRMFTPKENYNKDEISKFLDNLLKKADAPIIVTKEIKSELLSY